MNGKMPKPLDYFCIFAGGGVRGTAYIGILKTLKDLNINIRGLAGSSVGAIMATLYAIGYTHEEIYEIAFSLNYELFRDLFLPFGKDFGICKGENFLSWMKKSIEKKYYGSEYREDCKPVTFKDLDTDLIIIATNISTTNFKEFSRYETPDVEIAQAIRASISIPGFFKPVWDGDICLVDGDIIKNLPLWTVSKNIIPDDYRILEFRLEGSKDLREINNPFDYFNAVIDTSTNISTDFIINLFGKNDRYDFIKIDTGKISIIDFSISNENKEKLVQTGIETTHLYFTKTLAAKKSKLKEIYSKLFEYLNQIKKQILKNKLNEAQVELGKLSLLISDNNDILNTSMHDELRDIKREFIENIHKSIIFKNYSLKNKDSIIKLIDKSLLLLKKEIENISEYLNQIKP